MTKANAAVGIVIVIFSVSLSTAGQQALPNDLGIPTAIDGANVATFDVLGIELRSSADGVRALLRGLDPELKKGPGSEYRGTFGRIAVYFTSTDELFYLHREQGFQEKDRTTLRRVVEGLTEKYGPPNSVVRERAPASPGVSWLHLVWAEDPSLTRNAYCARGHSFTTEFPRDDHLIPGCVFLKATLTAQRVAGDDVVKVMKLWLVAHDVRREHRDTARAKERAEQLRKLKEAERSSVPQL